MAFCDCPRPREHSKQGEKTGYCVRCGLKIDTRYTSNDQTMREWLGKLSELPGVSPVFIRQCAARERAGRDTFEHRFLDRDNAAEATEEAADLANYCLMAWLKSRRDGRPIDEAAALDAAYHAALAYNALRRM